MLEILVLASERDVLLAMLTSYRFEISVEADVVLEGGKDSGLLGRITKYKTIPSATRARIPAIAPITQIPL
jgi:hypothetical protein